ncbi:MAG: MFS transporter, partial [Candidatus Thermoplasmatota archaeon]|nr:MFS transporter [Candidatus Thermoplasmatota archaeon]
QGVLVLWILTLLLAAAIPTLPLAQGWFWVAAVGAGLALGGTWASDRPLMLQLTPDHRVGEFYGLYGMVGRFAAVLGPLLWGLVVDTLGLGRPVAVLTLVGAMVLASFLLAGVEPEQA